MSTKIEELKKRRTVVRSMTTKLINNCKEYLQETEHDLCILNENIDLLDSKYNSLKELDKQIQELIEATEYESEFETCEVYSEKIISMKSKLTFMLKENRKPEIPVSNTIGNIVNNDISNISVSHSKIKLPKLSINKFNGDPVNWLSFWNQFDNAIHQNSDLTDTDKFNYLISFLSGAACNAVSGFALSSENYFAAIELLKTRFGRTDLIINAHMGKLLNLEPVRNANNIFALRKLYDDIEIQIRSLKSLNVTSGTYGTLLTPVLLKLIPNELNLDFQRKRKSKDNFDVNELLEFLKTEIECRESMLQIQDKINNHNSSHFPKEKRINKISIPTAAVLKVSINSCIFCEDSEKEKHTSEACPKSVTDRKASLRKLGMCYLCLKRGNHLAKNCFSKIKCDSCGWKHNSLICDRNSLDEKKIK
ncbi:uncharacterized protein LOC118205622 [Stegodyphus dumicola]|uniref:uncharacterized protein LOC118205622 n=1 Tax=Stegodyphus dumicola TaxID=202533 RepID=UPI0015B165BC|nr:uncharacterized protein LOC118205622 [Stegodyphus dumicola]